MTEYNPTWVGVDYEQGFPASADRETARTKAREICQRIHNKLMAEWERKHVSRSECAESR